EVLGMIDSTIGFRVRLPLGDWNKKLMFKGCGGGCGFLASAVDILSRGYATATTDMGHQGQYGQFFFARNNRQSEIDFGYRSTHLSTVMAKLMIEDFYGSGPKLSYFYGGSTGGRQGLVLAQRYPVDYDGIIVNYPALNEVGLGA